MSKKATTNSDVSLSRRKTLLFGGTLLAGGTSIIALTRVPTAAALSVDTFDVQNASFESESVTPEIVMDLAYEFQVSEVPEEVRIKLQVDNETVEQVFLSPSQSSVEDSTRLTGLVTDSANWSSSDFTVEPGEEISHELTITVLLDVVVGGEVVASDTRTDTATVEVAHPDQVTVKASIGGSGEIQSA